MQHSSEVLSPWCDRSISDATPYARWGSSGHQLSPTGRRWRTASERGL